MNISQGMLNHYINYVTSFYVLEHDEPFDEVTDCYEYVQELKIEATQKGDLEPLKLGINYLLCHSEISLDNHGGAYTWDDEEVREILHYIRSIVWPDAPKVNCEEVKDVELTDTTDIDWWKMRGVQP